jgi:LuxR family maltose regulon positive regulatory protein
LTTTLINEIAGLPEEFLLVLDDFHLIAHKDVHQLISALMQHAPPPLHLVIASRRSAPFPITRLRASQAITEIRLADLRFTLEEVQSYLKLCLGADVSPQIVTVLAERTEGWVVGLRMACLALRDQDDYVGFLETFQGTQRFIIEYLVDEVLSRQPGPVQTFLLRTSILDRFCAPLCDAVCLGSDEGPLRETNDEGRKTDTGPSSFVLRRLSMVLRLQAGKSWRSWKGPIFLLCPWINRVNGSVTIICLKNCCGTS